MSASVDYKDQELFIRQDFFFYFSSAFPQSHPASLVLPMPLIQGFVLDHVLVTNVCF
jgi:hypothetical protein